MPLDESMLVVAGSTDRDERSGLFHRFECSHRS
jgi:hypothetical protein